MIVLQTSAGSGDLLVLLLSYFELMKGQEKPSLWSNRRSLTQIGERWWQSGVAAIPVVDPSISLLLCRASYRPIRMSASQNRPRDARKFVGEGRREQIAARHAFGRTLDP
jgi:hypothetical protein